MIYYTILYYTILYYTILYYTILYYRISQDMENMMKMSSQMRGGPAVMAVTLCDITPRYAALRYMHLYQLHLHDVHA